VVERLLTSVAPVPWPALEGDALPEAELRRWVLPAIYERIRHGQGIFLAELRPAVALFLGFDDFDYDGDPGAGEHLDAYIRWVQAVIARYDGALLQLTVGDKGSYLYAAFGAPIAHDDDIVRAVATALELRSPPVGLPVAPNSVRIGLSQGLMRAGAYGGVTRRTYGVLGNEVNLAARLMQQARPGQLVVSKRVADAASSRYRFGPLGAVALKGKPEPVPIFELLGRPEQIAGGTSLGRSPSPGGMVGRAEERAVLAQALAALQRGVSGVVLIEGEAGIGKSRLLADILDRTTMQGATTTLLGAGDAIEQRTPYHAWRPIFERVFDWERLGADPETRRASVLAQLHALPEAAFVVERAPLLNAVLPLDWDDNALTAQMTGEGRAVITNEVLIRVLRHIGPLALIMEDAHWLDSASWALLRAVVERLSPALIVVATRPQGEPLPAEYHALCDRPETRQLRLTALPPAETLQLVCARLGVAALPAPVAELIQQKAEGHPFFSEELALALRDAGLIEIRDGACRLAPGVDLRAVSFPDTAQGVVTSRIDRLTPAQQLALKAASVIGRVFALRMLRDVHPIEADKPELPETVQALAQLDLTPLETPEPDLAYLFKHIITQEAAYNLLLFAQRQQLHRAVAEWIEREYAADLSPHYSLLAYHWGKAEEWSKTVTYLELAGEQALSRGAYREAVDFFSEALGLAGSLPAAERSRFREGCWHSRLGQAYLGLGRLAESTRYSRRALALFGWPVPESGRGLLAGIAVEVLRQAVHLALPPRRRARHSRGQSDADGEREALHVTGYLTTIAYEQQATLPLVYYSVRGLNMAERGGPASELAMRSAVASHIAGALQLHALARHYDRRSGELLQRVDDLEAVGVCALSTAIYRSSVCQLDGLPELLEQGAQAAEQIGNMQLSDDNRLTVGLVYYLTGDLARSHAQWASVSAAARQDNPLHCIWGLIGQVMSGLWLGQDGEVLLAQLQEAERLAQDDMLYPPVTIALSGLFARVHLRLGDVDRARAAADRAASGIAKVRPTVFLPFPGYTGAAEAYLELWRLWAAADPAQAPALKVRARVACRALWAFARPFRFARPRGWLLQGLYEWQSGNAAKARQAWTQSLAEAEKYAMPQEAGRAHYLLGLYGSPQERQDHLAQAVAIFERLGAAYDLGLTRAAQTDAQSVD
jgi:hypothetical protein